MDSGEFWLWTILFIFTGYAIVKLFYICVYSEIDYRSYEHLNDKSNQLYTVVTVKSIN